MAHILKLHALGLDAEAPGHPGPQHGGGGEAVQQDLGADIGKKNGEQEGRENRADLCAAAAKPAPSPRTWVGNTSPAIR